MDWMSWKTWTSAALIIIVIFAIYTFAASDGPRSAAPVKNPDLLGEGAPGDAKHVAANSSTAITGFEPVHKEWIEPQVGAYKSERNLFAYVEPPPPPPPPPPAAPPDRDKDGVPDFKDNCVDKYNPDQADLDHNGVGDICQAGFVPPPPPPPPAPVPPTFDFKYIGTFGGTANPIATFTRNGEIVNVHVGDTIDGKFILRSIGIESVEIGYVGFPPDRRDRIPLAQ